MSVCETCNHEHQKPDVCEVYLGGPSSFANGRWGNFCDCTNGSVYEGTRQDWIERCYGAERRAEIAEAKLEKIHELAYDAHYANDDITTLASNIAQIMLLSEAAQP